MKDGGARKAEAETGSSPKDKKLKQDGKAQAEEEEKVEMESEEADEELDMKSMMKRMMSMMKQMQSNMCKSKEDTEEIKTIANQAKVTASMVEQTVEIVRGEVNQIRESAVSKEDLPKMVQEIVQSEGLTTGSSMKEGIGKTEKPGAVRFKTEEAMWKYFADSWGKLQHEVMGETIYANPDSLHDSNPRKTKTVRKVVRTIIESNPGNGDDIKKSIDTDYGRGIVWWNDRRVAEWKENEGEGKMKLLGAAEQCQETIGTFVETFPWQRCAASEELEDRRNSISELIVRRRTLPAGSGADRAGISKAIQKLLKKEKKLQATERIATILDTFTGLDKIPKLKSPVKKRLTQACWMEARP
ncbi:unnamed protein product [Prorocentrum cordatum]|uniref:Uncharacterized protein n=1 Tax=Prorocentrum cordatum TaxID=2364126 RepID=A0ABN9XS99_9DINO|nr:unnamed protein product [Polarella glacialis]